MGWFERTKKNLATSQKKEVPNVWLKCEKCDEVLYIRELEKNFHVCLNCSHHFRISSDDYRRILIDDGSFEEFNRDIISVDPLGFVDSKPYTERIKSTIEKTGRRDAVVTGFGRIDGRSVSIGIMEFKFIGGSMGSVVGEKLAQAIHQAQKNKLPCIIISASGGARMQEGALSLMQMAKTSARLAQLADAGLPFISILTDPTTGGVTASFAMLGDVILSEPGALIGFAGPRVIRETIGRDLPEGFQRAEFLLDKGFIDMIVSRMSMKESVAKLLDFFGDFREKPFKFQPDENVNHKPVTLDAPHKTRNSENAKAKPGNEKTEDSSDQ